MDPADGGLHQLTRFRRFLRLVVGLPKSNARIRFMGVHNILYVGLEFVFIFSEVVLDFLTGRDEPAAVVHTVKGCGIMVIRGKYIFIRLGVTIIEKYEGSLNAILVCAGQKILDLGE